MHQFLRSIILDRNRTISKLSKINTTLARKIVTLTKLDPDELFRTIMNSYLYHTIGQKLLGDTTIIPPQLTQDFQDLDDLYYQVSELYKEATGKTPPIRRDIIINGQPINIKHNTNKPSLILITTPQNNPHELIIDPTTEMAITIYFP